MVVALIITWVAACYRLRITFTEPRTLWRTSFTTAVTLVAVGVTAHTFTAGFDRLTPNLSSLVTHACTTAAAGAVLIYLLTLSTPDPSPGAVRACAAAAATTTAVQLATWALAPIHTRPLAAVQPSDDGAVFLLAYFMSYYVFLVGVLISASLISALIAGSRHREGLSPRVGLGIISASTMLGAVALGSWAIGTAQTLSGGDADHPLLHQIGQIAAPWAIGGIGAGTLIFLIAPAVADRLRRRRMLADLRPLHARLMAAHPGLSIPMSTLSQRATTTNLTLERMLIEIHDALEQTPVADQSDIAPYGAVAAAILAGDAPAPTRPASAVLPRMSTRVQEQQVLTQLATTVIDQDSRAPYARS